MTASLITPVILCGGNGTRLWPRSRAKKPKPFLQLVGAQTLFEEALSRCSDAGVFAGPIVVTGSGHLPHVKEQLECSFNPQIIVEPAGKNTAAAIALAALRLDPDDIMLICPSDHHIGNHTAFVSTACAAAKLASQGWLVSFGIEAKKPDIGFGYLRRGEAIGESGYHVAQFVEKPDFERAKAYIADGGYAWNGGIFAFRVQDYIHELELYRPEILQAVRAAVELGTADGYCFHPDVTAFSVIDGDSVDYAVMENTKHAAMVSADMAWSDIGNWEALYAARPCDSDGNVSSGRVELVDCQNVLVDSDGPRVSVIGLQGVIVVVDGDDILVTTAAGAQKVGKLNGAVNQ